MFKLLDFRLDSDEDIYIPLLFKTPAKKFDLKFDVMIQIKSFFKEYSVH
jgi:hypothetical protein